MMEKLPREIAFEIFYRLPLESLVRCRFVCKSWCSLLTYYDDGDSDDGNCFAKMHLRRRRHDDQQRNLEYLALNFIAIHKEEGSAVVEFHNTEYDDEVGLNCKVNRLVFSLNYISGWLSMTRLVESCNGLLCLVTTYQNGTEQNLKDRIIICNPVLHEYVTLPLSVLQSHEPRGRHDRSPNKKVDVITGCGYNPITDEYKVVGVFYRRDYIGDVEVYTLGKSSSMWRRKETIKLRLRNDSRPVHINGSIHWLANTEKLANTESELKIVSFDLEDEEFRVIWTLKHVLQLKELRGCLCLIGTRDIWVSKDPMNRKELWVKEFSIEWVVGKKSYSPVVIKKKKKHGDADALLCWRNNKRLVSYDPKTEKFEKVFVGGRKIVVDKVITDSVLHINSLVSLKALGENVKYAEEWLPRQGPWIGF